MDYYKRHLRISLEERKKIEELTKNLTPLTEISRVLSRSAATIRNEIEKGFVDGIYKAEIGQTYAQRAQRQRNKKASEALKRLAKELPLEEIKTLLAEGASTRTLSLRYSCSRHRIIMFLRDNNLSSVGQKEKTVQEKIDSLEMQVEILFEQIKELSNEKANNRL
jgi:IS30 family transposase